MSWKRPLFLFHRWAGIVLCVFIALWFVSGIVMMYVDFPALTRPESLAGQPALNFSNASLTPAQAIAKLEAGDFSTFATQTARSTVAPATMPRVRAVKLGMVLERPVYRVYPDNGAQPRTVFADTGEVLRDVDAELARTVAADFAARAGYTRRVETKHIELRHVEQWTVSGALNDHRPLHRVALDDQRGTELYVSSTTGAVVRDTHRQERILNYFGAVTHWVYPTFLRKHQEAWEWTVDILSGFGCALGVTGLWIGVLRWRRKRSPGKPAVPYRGLMRWHYFSGIVFGVVLLTWMASGLLSMNPLDLDPPRSPSAEQRLALSGRNFNVADFDAPAKVLPPETVEAELVYYDAQPFYSISMRDGARNLIAASDEPARLPNQKRLTMLAAELLPGSSVGDIEMLLDYDNYYYSRRPENQDRPLPVLRVKFNDADSTWFHIDAVTGQPMEKLTRTNRLFRWLYNGLHSWDLLWLKERRPLWDVGMIAFLSGGLLLTGIGVTIGYRRLRR